MADGHFIREGDKTTCGGKVLEADTRVMMFGIASCPRRGCGFLLEKTNKTYVIVGGVSYIGSHGRFVAGTLDSSAVAPAKPR